MGIFNADVIINIPPAFFSLQKSGLVRVYLTSVFLLLSVPRCFGDQKPQFDSRSQVRSRFREVCPPSCGWRGYEREEKEGEREVDNLSTCGCVIQLYLWENTRFIEIREFGWGFLMLTS